MNSLHGVSLYNAHIRAFLKAGVDSDGVCLLSYEVGNHISDLHAQDQLVWEFLIELKHKATIATANIDNGWDKMLGLGLFLRFQLGLLRCQIGYRVLVSVNIHLILMVVLDSKESWVMKRPIDTVGIDRAINLVKGISYVGIFKSPIGLT